MNEENKVPDYFEPLVGWRYWDININSKELYSRGNSWPVKEKKVAIHDDSYSAFFNDKLECKSISGCYCGIYAFKKTEYLKSYIATDNFCTSYHAIGQVYLWGKVIEHERGYRAEFAYPKSIHYVYKCPSVKINKQLGKYLAKHYGIEFIEGEEQWISEESYEKSTQNQFQIPFQWNYLGGPWMGIMRTKAPQLISSLPNYQRWKSPYLYNPIDLPSPIKKPKNLITQPSLNIHKPIDWWKDSSGLWLRSERL